MKAYVFPGQASQFEGMGKDLYESSIMAKAIFEEANEILGYRISDVMFEGSAQDLKETRITQPAVFLHSVVKRKLAGNNFQPDAVAGHSLGEFSALVAAESLSFKNGLLLVKQRALAMQKACEQNPSTMAAIVGLEDDLIEKICNEIDDIVVPANYNSPGQLVISGTVSGVEKAVEEMTKAGAKRAILLQVGGAFHSELMEPAREELQIAIEATEFKTPICPVYQNVTALPETNPEAIKDNLIKQLTAPVLWTQTIQNLIKDGVDSFIEVGGTGKILCGLIRRIERSVNSEAL